MRKGEKLSCTDSSSIFNKIRKSKHNGKVLANNDVRIGDDMAMCSKTNVVYKLETV